ncbi:hypothetical protein D3C73_1458830 [compost metagenome]
MDVKVHPPFAVYQHTPAVPVVRLLFVPVREPGYNRPPASVPIAIADKLPGAVRIVIKLAAMAEMDLFSR